MRPRFPGMIVLDEHLAVVSMTLEAERWLAEIGGADWPSASELPVPVYSAAAGLLRLEAEADPSIVPPPATVRLRSRAGRWLSLHASRLSGPPAPQVGVVIEPTPAAQVGPLLLSAYGLTAAQSARRGAGRPGRSPPARSSGSCTSRPTPSRST